MLLAEGANFVASRQGRDNSFFRDGHGSRNDRKADGIFHPIPMSESNGEAGVEGVASAGRVSGLH